MVCWAALALLHLHLQIPAGGPADLPPTGIPGDGVQWVRSFAALVGVCLAAWWTLRWAARRGIGQLARGRNIRVIERVALDPRRSIYLVEVGSRALLLGASEHSLTTLAEVRPEDLAERAAEGKEPQRDPGVQTRFANVLARIRGDHFSPQSRHLHKAPYRPPCDQSSSDTD